MPFLVPLYQHGGESRALMRPGMLLYEGLSGFRNYRLHRFMSREETLSLAPALFVDGLTGGCLYYDAVVSDNRWTVETVKDGVRQGGLAINYAPLTGLLTDRGKVIGGRIHDKIGDEHYEIRARAVVNATGVFADQIRRMDDPDCAQLVRLSKGTHLVFAEEDVPLSVTVVFSSPWARPLSGQARGLLPLRNLGRLGGSRSGRASTRRERCRVSAGEPRSIHARSGAGWRKGAVVYSGFRPLLSAEDGDLDSAAATREDHIEVSLSGLISVIGGKLTTARIMAIRVLDLVIEKIGGATTWSRCCTHRLSIGGRNEAVAEDWHTG